jgi:hypothetical protein
MKKTCWILFIYHCVGTLARGEAFLGEEEKIEK